MNPHRCTALLAALLLGSGLASGHGQTAARHPSSAVVRQKSVVVKPVKQVTHAPQPTGLVVVRPGDTLFRIARAHGLSVDHLRALNGLKNGHIRPGLRLRVVAVAPPKALRVVWTLVSLPHSDTLRAVAARYQVAPLRLMQVNHFWGQRLGAGQRLLVPRRSEVVGPPAPAQAGPAVRVSALRVLGVPVTAARVDLNRPGVRVAPVMPLGGVGKVGARLGTLAKLSGAELVVNGGFFHPQTYALAGDLVSGGRLLALGSSPVALAVTSDNHARILDVTPGSSWAGFETVVSGGPHLLSGGALSTNLHRGLSDPAIFGRRTRTMLGLRSSTELLLVVTRKPVTVTEAAKLLRALGARDGMLLDGGSSSGMAYKGRELLASGRKVAYGLGIQTNYVGLRFMR